jgi:hypothetical protein
VPWRYGSDHFPDPLQILSLSGDARLTELDNFQRLFIAEEVSAMCVALSCGSGDRASYVHSRTAALALLTAALATQRPCCGSRCCSLCVPMPVFLLEHTVASVGRLFSPGGVRKPHDSVRDAARTVFNRQLKVAKFEVCPAVSFALSVLWNWQLTALSAVRLLLC